MTRRDGQNSADLASMAGTKRLADYYVKSTAFTGTDNVYTAVATRMSPEQLFAGGGSNCSWTARYVGPRVGNDVPGPRAGDADRHRPAGAVGGQKALGVKVDVTKTPQTYLLGVDRPDRVERRTRPRPRSPASRLEHRPASCCRSRWSPCRP